MLSNSSKECKVCKRVLATTEFYSGHARCKTCCKQLNKKWYEANKPRVRSLNKEWKRKNATRIKELNKRCRDRLRTEILAAYGNKCVCCGEAAPEFLSVDHVFNDGAAERRASGNIEGSNLYWQLRREGFPKDRYQLLCYNCNFAKGRYGGVCPHEKYKLRVVSND